MENGDGNESPMEWEEDDEPSNSNPSSKAILLAPIPQIKKKKRKPRDLRRQNDKDKIQLDPEEQGAVRINNIRYWDNKKAGTGKGGTGSVYQGKYIVNSKKSHDAAVKKIDPQHVEVFDNEIYILGCLNHQNIVKYYGSVPSGDYLYIAMELCDIDMEEYVTKHDPSPNFEEIVTYLKQICEALCSMHKTERKGIVHRDIKPSNILLKFSEKPPHTAKLTDFGLSKNLEHYKHQSQTSTGGKGTQMFMSPECLRCQEPEDEDEDPRPFKATKESDIYSLGLTIYFCLTGGKHPCGRAVHLLPNLMKGKIDLSVLQLNKYALVYHMIECMLKPDPQKRPNMEEILLHPSFWTPTKTLRFISDASIVLSQNSEFSTELQSQYTKLKVPDWTDRLSTPVKIWLENLAGARKNSKKYNGTSVIKLVEFIRDKDQHQNDWTKEIRVPNVFGNEGEFYVKYFTDRFPFLVNFLFVEMQSLRDQRKLCTYYDYNLRQHNSYIWPRPSFYEKCDPFLS